MKRVACFIVAISLAAPTMAFAQEESLDAASEIRFKEGVAFAKQGKYEQARGSFLQTLALSPGSPKVLLNLAISEHGAGHPVEALGHLKSYLANPRVDPKKAQDIRASLYDELWRATGHLKIQADRGDALVLDGDVKLGNAPLADLVDVAAGKHRVAAGPRTTDVTVSAGETKDVVLVTDHPTAPVTPPAAHVPPERQPVPTASEGTFWKPTTFVLGGATLVAGGIALFFNSKSHDAADRGAGLRSAHVGADCSPASAPSFCADILSANHDQDSAASASKGFWIGGGVLFAGTAVSAILWATHGSPSSKTGVLVPSIGPGHAGATYHLAF